MLSIIMGQILPEVNQISHCEKKNLEFPQSLIEKCSDSAIIELLQNEQEQL